MKHGPTRSNAPTLRRLTLLVPLLALGAASAFADVVVIEAMNGPNVGSVTPFPPYAEIVGSWASSSTINNPEKL